MVPTVRARREAVSDRQLWGGERYEVLEDCRAPLSPEDEVAETDLGLAMFGQTSACAAQLASYVEIDFPENTTKKAMAIRKSKELSSHLGKPEDVRLGMFFTHA